MSNTAAATELRSVVVEREIPHPPEKIWRALTQPHLIQEWLMKNDFMPIVGHDFKLSADWGAVECRVTAVEPNRTLAYTWGAYGLESVVTWTLTPARAPICAWSRQVSDRTSNRPTVAPRPVGRGS